MEVFLVRHGATEWNHLNRWQGRTDIPLSETGRTQAAATAHYLSGILEGPSVVYSSDLSRASETAAAIAREFSLEPVRTPLLREANIGIWNGLEISESFQRHGDMINRWRNDPWIELPNTESLGQLQSRSVGFMNYLKRNYPLQTVIVVSHALLIKSIICYILGMPLQNNYNFHIDNCSVSSVRFQEDKWRVIELNNWRHIVRPE
jgi:broad specificity phosphatase PhoE